jgi:hypothetical protein
MPQANRWVHIAVSFSFGEVSTCSRPFLCLERSEISNLIDPVAVVHSSHAIVGQQRWSSFVKLAAARNRLILTALLMTCRVAPKHTTGSHVAGRRARRSAAAALGCALGVGSGRPRRTVRRGEMRHGVCLIVAALVRVLRVRAVLALASSVVCRLLCVPMLKTF